LKQVTKNWLAILFFYLILVFLVNWNLYRYQQKKDNSYLIGVNRMELQIQRAEEETGQLAANLEVTWDLITGYDCISVDSSRKSISTFFNENRDKKQVIYTTERGYYKNFLSGEGKQFVSCISGGKWLLFVGVVSVCWLVSLHTA